MAGVDITTEEEDTEETEPPALDCRIKRCGDWHGCRAAECGECENCRDMVKRGGKGLKKQPCEKRACVEIAKGSAEREAERMANQERYKERREAARQERFVAEAEDRQRRSEAKLAARAAKEAEKEEARAARARAAEARELLKLKPGAADTRKASAPTHPTELPAYGWGVLPASSYSLGMEVEVLGVEEGLRGACFSGRVVTPTAEERKQRPKGAPPKPDRSLFFPQAELSGSGSGSGSSGSGGGGASDKAVTSVPPLAAAGKGGGASYIMIEFPNLQMDDSEGSPLLREWASTHAVRLRPPSCPAGFLSLVRPGDKLQFLLEETYWDVTLEEFAATTPSAAAASGGAAASAATAASTVAAEGGGGGEARPFRVASVYYMASHYARADELRPMWIWDGGRNNNSRSSSSAPRWRYELMAGSGVRQEAVAREESCDVFLYAPAAPRRHNWNFHQEQLQRR